MNASFRQRCSAGRFAFALAFLGLFNPFLTADAQHTSEKKVPKPPSAAAASEEVRIKHGDNTLAGVLHLPKGKGPHPAIIFIHGDGPTDRGRGGSYAPIWDRFLECGFACLSWDKPGIGASTNPAGHYERQSYYQRAAELRRAIDFLKARKDIDSKRIGCWGTSQAGWIMPMVASRSKDIAFIIAVSCPGQTASVQSAYYMRCQAFDKGEPVEKADAAAALVRFSMKLLPAAAKPADHFWKHLEGSDPDYIYEGAHKGPEWDGSFFIEPAPLLERTTCPVLAIFGTKDRNVDAEASANVYRRAFDNAGNKQGTSKFFEDADHSIRVVTKEPAKDKGGSASGKIYALGDLDAMAEWLKKLPAPEPAKK